MRFKSGVARSRAAALLPWTSPTTFAVVLCALGAGLLVGCSADTNSTASGVRQGTGGISNTGGSTATGGTSNTGGSAATGGSDCVPDCSARECGSDGCDGRCGVCDSSEQCSAAGLCSCSPNTFQCNNGDCIPGSWECDNETDCTDGSDEHCTPDLPDLVIEGFSVNVFTRGAAANQFMICLNRNASGEDVDEGHYVAVANRGSSTASTYAIRFGLTTTDANRSYVSPTKLRLNTGTTHPPGIIKRWSGPLCGEVQDVAPGSYVLWFAVDLDAEIEESNEDNNRRAGSNAYTVEDPSATESDG